MSKKSSGKKKTKKKGCNCPSVDVKKYDNETITWKDRYFYITPQPCFFHEPINFAVRIENAFTYIQDKGLKFNEKKHMIVQKDGMFRGKLMLGVSKPGKKVKGVHKLNKKFIAKSHVGSYKELGNTVRNLFKQAYKKGKILKGIYFWYTTCPECAKGDQHKVVVMGEI